MAILKYILWHGRVYLGGEWHQVYHSSGLNTATYSHNDVHIDVLTEVRKPSPAVTSPRGNGVWHPWQLRTHPLGLSPLKETAWNKLAHFSCISFTNGVGRYRYIIRIMGWELSSISRNSEPRNLVGNFKNKWKYTGRNAHHLVHFI